MDRQESSSREKSMSCTRTHSTGGQLITIHRAHKQVEKSGRPTVVAGEDRSDEIRQEGGERVIWGFNPSAVCIFRMVCVRCRSCKSLLNTCLFKTDGDRDGSGCLAAFLI